MVKFDGDGTMTLTEKGVFQNHGGSNPGFFPIATYFDICAGTYQVESDLSFSYELSCTVKLLTGFNAGSTISIDGLRLTGQIDRDRDTYIASNVTGAVQTMTFSTGFVNQRICGGETTGVKLSK